MPFDPTNSPAWRRPSYRITSRDTTLPSSGGGEATLNLERMILEEYGYAAKTAEQAVVDRDFSYKQQMFVVLGALVIGGLVLTRLYQNRALAGIHPLALALALFVGLAGTFAFLMLVQFHAAFSDSLRTLRALRDYYEAHRTAPAARLEAQVQWRRLRELEKIRYAPKNLALGSTFTLASALGLGLAALIATVIARGDTTDVLTPPAGTLPYAAGATLALITITAHLLYYYLRVGRHRTGQA